MKKNSTRLAPKTKVKVSLRNRLRYVTIAGAFAFGIFSVTMVYNSLINTEESRANNRFNGMETLAEFKFRKQLVLNQELIPENTLLQDFPVMVALADPDLKSASNGGKVLSEKGFDIRFTKADGVSLLEYEIEKYNPATGELVAWVNMDTLSRGISRHVYMYFSNKFSADESSQNTWNKTYKGVWHLRGILSSKTPFSTQVAQKAVTPVTQDKDVYVAAEKNSSRYPCLNTPEDVDITGDLSVSAWVYITGSKEMTILSNQNGFNGGYRLSLNKNQKLELSVSNENAESAAIKGSSDGTTLEKNKWYHVAAVYSDRGDSMCTYVNGKRDRFLTTYVSMAGSSSPLQIGREPSKKIFYFGGQIEEVHVRNVVMNNHWIQTEYVNQNNPMEFIKPGMTENITQQISMSLLTLDAETQGQTVELKWLTVNENNNELFTIERSTDGLTYEVIGTKPGAGNSIEVLSYRFRDEKPVVGKNFYRVKLTDTQGNNEFSMITPASVEAMGEDKIQIASAQPNPFNKDFMVEYRVPKTGMAKVKLTSVKGDVLHEQEVACEKSKAQHFQYKDDAGIRAGVYFLTIAQETESKTIKLIKKL
ncbi:MAG: DUF2341 domain-containing protein [Bacteroidia bacterium]|nr:DUF2341 domain-containing protein [Bacteroidia bacterium]